MIGWAFAFLFAGLGMLLGFGVTSVLDRVDRARALGSASPLDSEV